MATQSAPDAARPSKPRHVPDAHPLLPIVELRPGSHPLDVHFAAAGATQAAVDHPQAELFDMRGAALRLVEEDDGSARLVAAEKPNPVEVRRRVLDVLRATAQQGAADGRIPDDVEAVLRWLESAPSLEYLLHGLALAPTHDVILAGRTCRGCNWIQRMMLGVPPCCPG